MKADGGYKNHATGRADAVGIPAEATIANQLNSLREVIGYIYSLAENSKLG